MTVALDNDLEQIISARLATGKYGSASEILRASLQLLAEREAEEQQREAWRRDIASGLRQLDAGQSLPLDEQVLEDSKARGRARLAQQTQAEGA